MSKKSYVRKTGRELVFKLGPLVMDLILEFCELVDDNVALRLCRAVWWYSDERAYVLWRHSQEIPWAALPSDFSVIETRRGVTPGFKDAARRRYELRVHGTPHAVKLCVYDVETSLKVHLLSSDAVRWAHTTTVCAGGRYARVKGLCHRNLSSGPQTTHDNYGDLMNTTCGTNAEPIRWIDSDIHVGTFLIDGPRVVGKGVVTTTELGEKYYLVCSDRTVRVLGTLYTLSVFVGGAYGIAQVFFSESDPRVYGPGIEWFDQGPVIMPTIDAIFARAEGSCLEEKLTWASENLYATLRATVSMQLYDTDSD